MPEFPGVRGAIHYRRWEPEQPRALVVFFHGLGEHSGSYEPFAEALNNAGFVLWALDHAGHGRSEGVRVLVKAVDDLLDDAQTLLRLATDAHPDLPLIVAGHSLGSLVATLLVGEREVRPDALVLAGANLVPSSGGGPAELLANGIDPWDLRKDPAELSRNPEFVAQIRADPLTWQGGLRHETLTALGEAAPRVSTVLGSITVPVLFLHGTEDDLSPASGAERAAELLPDARVVLFPEDRHNILNELDRAEVYRVLIEFADSVLRKD